MLNTLRIFNESIGILSQNWRGLLEVLAIPIAAYCLLTLLDSGEEITLLSVAVGLVGLVLHVMIAVTTHRVAILGLVSVSISSVLNWTQRETLFFAYAVAIEVFVYLMQFTPVLLILPMLLLFVYMTARLSLIFPSIALDRPVSLSKAWRLTEHYGWDMFLIVVLYPVLLFMPVTVIFGLLQSDHLFVKLLSDVFYILITMITITMLSLAYREIIKPR